MLGKAALALIFLGLIGLGTAAAMDGGAWAAFARPGVHAIMRHAIAPGVGDPAGFRLGDCTTQRNLSEEGRGQARAIGQAIRASGVAVTRVLTSQWCRATETAGILGVAPVTEEPALNSFFADRASESDQTAAVRQLLRGAPATDKLLLVTHQVNITAVTQIVPASGEVLLFDLDDTGRVRLIDRILINPL